MEHRDIKTGAQLMVLVIYTLFTVMLISVTLMFSWDVWMVFLMFAGVIGVWSIHILQCSSERIRSYIYALCMFVEFFYYSIHETSFFDMSVVICIIFLALSVFDESAMVYMGMGTYLITVLYHIFVTGYILNLSTAMDYSRFCLQIMSVIVAAVLSRYMVKRREEERENYNIVIEKLQDTNRRSEDFMANISHELRTPINAVTGISDVLLQGQLEDDVRKNVKDIQVAGRRLFRQINDILDYSELVSDRYTIVEERYDVASMLYDSISSAVLLNRQKRLQIVYDISPNIPSELTGDQAKILRVMNNIIENAVKFTQKGGIRISVYSRKENYGINLIIKIEDTGIGIEDWQADRIYDRFYQADAGRTRKVGGMGLGLSIVHGIVKSMGGFMNIESAPKQGTIVTFCIPQHVSNSEPLVTVNNAGDKHVLCYFRQDKYDSVRVRQYYDETIYNMGKRLNVNLYRVYSQRDVENYISRHNVTHVFLGNLEYDENSSYYDELGKTMNVVLVVDSTWKKKIPAQLSVIIKPFSIMSIVDSINLVGGEIRQESDVVLNEWCFEGVRSLVVDDDSMNLNVARGILESYGMLVDTVTSGAEALSKCESNVYDVIFMDHMMPGMDGIESLHHIRKLGLNSTDSVPVIALTANAVSGAREMFIGEGFQEFVAKPIERTMLERALRNVLSSDMFSIKENNETEEIYAAKNEDNPLQKLEDEGFNVSNGIAYCAGSEEFYLEMLSDFYTSSGEKRESVRKSYELKDWKAYSIIVHTLKGNSRTLGADRMSEMAMELQAAAERQDTAYIDMHHFEFVQEFDNVISVIGTSVEIDKEVSGNE